MLFNVISHWHSYFYSYAICIRREEGYCCVEYSLCDGATSSYGLSSLHASQAMQDELCTEDWVGIDGKYVLFP